jgi:hypothetical protein
VPFVVAGLDPRDTEHVMTKALLITLSLVILPSVASAQSGPGSGTDLYRVQREWEAIMRDGRYERLLREGQANKQAFDRLQQRDSGPTATGSIPPRRR